MTSWNLACDLGFPALPLMFQDTIFMLMCLSFFIYKMGSENEVAGVPGKGCLGPSRYEPKWAPWPFLHGSQAICCPLQG